MKLIETNLNQLLLIEILESIEAKLELIGVNCNQLQFIEIN